MRFKSQAQRRAVMTNLYRHKAAEEKYVPLFYMTKDGKTIASIVTKDGSVRGKISSPYGRKEVGFVGAYPENVIKREKEYKQSLQKYILEMKKSA